SPGIRAPIREAAGCPGVSSILRLRTIGASAGEGPRRSSSCSLTNRAVLPPSYTQGEKRAPASAWLCSRLRASVVQWEASQTCDGVLTRLAKIVLPLSFQHYSPYNVEA